MEVRIRTKLLKFLSVVLLLVGLSAVPAFAAGFTYHVVQPASGTGSAERNFDYYVPSGYTPGTAVPLVVVLHGCRITDRTMTDLVGMEQFAERDKFIILYPFQNNDASSNDNDGRNPNCWGYWMSGNVHRGAGEVMDIVRMVDYMKSHFTIDNNRVHITGISSGGAMTTIAQVAYPDVFASSVMVEGVGYAETTGTYTGTSPCDLVLQYNMGTVRQASAVITDMRTEMNKSVLRQPPVMVMHNKKDCTVPIKVGQGIIDAFLGLRGADGLGISSTPTSSVNGSVDGMPYTWSKYGNDGSGNSLVEAVIFDVTEQQVLNAGVGTLTTDPWDPSGSSDSAVKDDTKRGHWWSGAARRGPWILNKGLNAAQVAADFFKAHPMNGGGGSSSGGGVPPTPTGVTVTGTTSSSVSLSWNTSSSATSYKVYRGATNVGSPTGTTFTDTGLSPSTTYSYQVSAMNASGESSKSTPAVNATTQGSATCYTASNWAHYTAGRAHSCSLSACANGSNQNMGALSTLTTTTLKQTGTNYYIIGTCP